MCLTSKPYPMLNLSFACSPDGILPCYEDHAIRSLCKIWQDNHLSVYDLLGWTTAQSYQS